MMAQVENLQVSWVQKGDTGALEISSTFKSICTASYAGIDQAKYETLVLAKGNALNTWSITPPVTSLLKSPRKSGGEELTQTSEGGSQLMKSADAPVEMESPSPSPAKPAKGAPKRGPRSSSSGDQSVTSLQERSENSRMREKAEALEQEAVSSAKASARKARSASEADARGSSSGSAKKRAKKSAESALNLQDFPTE